MGPFKTTHPLYHIWYKMIERCTNPSSSRYEDYGGSGIYVCDRWSKSFASFVEDMGHRPSLEHSLDRIDFRGPYSPDNCRWASTEVQNNNKSNTRHLEHNGDVKSIAMWSRVTGLAPRTIRKRLAKGLPVSEVLDTPALKPTAITDAEGTRLSIIEWAQRLGCHPQVIRKRLNSGWTWDQAVHTPVAERKART